MIGEAMNFQQARSNMIEQQVRPWDVLDQNVLDVLAEVPRDAFVQPENRGIAYSDYALPIGYGQHMFKPTLDGRLLQALQVTHTDTVLEIGTGSGYVTACIARLAHHCESLECIGDLNSSAAARLEAIGIANITLRMQDAADDWDARDEYNAIAFGGAVDHVPERYLNKLAIGGRLFAIQGSPASPTLEAVLVTRISDNEWNTESLFETRVAHLVNFVTPPPSFVF